MYVTVYIGINVGTDRFVLAQQIPIVFHKRIGEDPHKAISFSILGCIGVIRRGKIEWEGIYCKAEHTYNMLDYISKEWQIRNISVLSNK